MINKRAYKYYVLENGLIESGWEYREDARDQLKELVDPKAGKVLMKTALRGMGLDPDSNASWKTTPITGKKKGRGALASEANRIAHHVMLNRPMPHGLQTDYGLTPAQAHAIANVTSQYFGPGGKGIGAFEKHVGRVLRHGGDFSHQKGSRNRNLTESEKKALGLDDPKENLFIGVFPGGISYAHKKQEEHGDYKKLAFLDYGTLQLNIKPGTSPRMRAAILRDAKRIQDMAGQDYPIDTSGHTVRLGGRR